MAIDEKLIEACANVIAVHDGEPGFGRQYRHLARRILSDPYLIKRMASAVLSKDDTRELAEAVGSKVEEELPRWWLHRRDEQTGWDVVDRTSNRIRYTVWDTNGDSTTESRERAEKLAAELNAEEQP